MTRPFSTKRLTAASLPSISIRAAGAGWVARFGADRLERVRGLLRELAGALGD